MINLGRHIEILLLENDCVIVPGLGGFIAHHVPAHFDENTFTFLPPLRTLGFNQQLKINDSLLAQSYIEAYDISYPEAIRRIEDEVNELQQTLHNEGVYEISEIGSLNINENGKIEFTPCEAGILTPDFYALNSLDIHPLKAKDTKQKEKIDEMVESPATVGVITPITELSKPAKLQTTETDSEKVDEEVSEEQKDSKTITIRLSTIRYAIATAAIVVGIVFFALNPATMNNGTINKSSMDSGGLYGVLPKEIVEPKVKPTTEVPTKEEEMVVNDEVCKQETEDITQESKTESKDIAKKANTNKPHFTIVLASRITADNATKMSRELNNEGYKATTITRPNGSKVILGNYLSEEDARIRLRELRAEHPKFTDAWVMEIN